ncbi:hypothetical protein Bca101_000080 [Brassica carinata]
MGEPNRKPFLGRKPIILNPKAPLHSLKVRERDACQDPHCEEPRITRPPRVDRITIREARVERSKPHLFTGMQTTVATILGNPPEVDNRFRQDQRESATKSPPWSPNPKSKSVDRELVPDQIGEEAGERTVLSEPPLSRRRSPAKSGAVRATVSRNEVATMCKRYHRFPELSSLTGDKID